MALPKTSVVVTGHEQLIAKVNSLPPAVMRRVARAGMSKACSLVSKEMKRLAPRDSGLLRRSIGSKTKTYSRGKNRGTTVGIVGPRVGFRQAVPRTMWLVKGDKRRLLRRTKTVEADPVKYAHLVDLGTKPHAITFKHGGKSITVKHPGSKAQSFIARTRANTNAAVEKTLKDAMLQGMADGVKKKGR